MISDLTPRKGHFSFSLWQRHGKTVPQTECALKGHPNMPGPSERVASSWCAPWGAETLLLSLRVGITLFLQVEAEGKPVPWAGLLEQGMGALARAGETDARMRRHAELLSLDSLK
jgi:hypothetical protein